MKCIFFIMMVLGSQIFCQVTTELDGSLEFNSGADTLFFLINGMDCNESQLIVSDKVDFKLKSISLIDGSIKTFGGHGKGPGEFTFGPYKVAVSKEFIASIDHTSNTIQVFDHNLLPVKSLMTPMAISDLGFDNFGNLLVASPFILPNFDAVSIYSRGFQKQFGFNPQNSIGNELLDMFVLIPFGEGSLILMYRYRNLLQLYDFDGNLIGEIIIPNLPLVSTTRKMKFPGTDLIRELPETDMFWDIDIDEKGIVYVLGGDHSSRPASTVYRISQFSEIDSFYIKYPTEEFCVHGGNLWGLFNDGASIKKYLIK